MLHDQPYKALAVGKQPPPAGVSQTGGFSSQVLEDICIRLISLDLRKGVGLVQILSPQPPNQEIIRSAVSVKGEPFGVQRPNPNHRILKRM